MTKVAIQCWSANGYTHEKVIENLKNCFDGVLREAVEFVSNHSTCSFILWLFIEFQSCIFCMLLTLINITLIYPCWITRTYSK